MPPALAEAFSATALLGAAAAGISLAGFALYARSILRGRSRPSRMTWGILAALSLLVAGSYASLGARDTLLPALILPLEACTIFALSLRHGTGGRERVDMVTLAGVAVAGLAWVATGDALAALLLALTVDALALAPTFAKTWTDPGSEDPAPWAAAVLGNLLNVAALDLSRMGEWTADLAAFPLYMLAANGLVLALALRRTGLRAA